MASRELKVEIIGDSKSLQRALGKASDSASGFGSKFAKAGKVVGLAALGMGAAVGAGLFVTLKKGFEELADSQKVMAQTGAVIKSTGGIANVTAKDVEGLSESLSHMSGVDDEVIASGENMLLTFKNIRNEVGQGNDIFDKATGTLLDMSTALGTDMNKSAIQLGKALNDPIKGITALTRVGVTFTEGQKETIKSLVEGGKTMEAQKIILKELNSEFGGSAKAFGDTMPGQLAKLKNAFDEVAGEMAVKFLPILTSLVTWVNAHWPQISAVFDAVGTAIVASFNAIGIAVNYLRGQWEIHRESAMKAWAAVQTAVQRFIVFFQTQVVPAIQSVVTMARAVWDHFGGEIISIGTRLVASVKQIFLNMVAPIRIILAVLRGDWSEAWNIMKQVVTGTLGTMLGNIKAALGGFVSAAADIGAGILRGIANGLKGIATAWFNAERALLGAIASAVAAVYTAAYNIGTRIVSGVWDGFSSMIGGLKSKISGAIGGLISGIDIPGFSPPEHAAAKGIGIPLARGVGRGFSEGMPRVGSEINAAFTEMWARQQAALTQKIASARAAFRSAFAGLISAALAAFDEVAAAWRPPSLVLLDKMELEEQKASLLAAIETATAELAVARAGGDPQAILDAEQRLADARLAQTKFNLQQQGIAEQEAHDKQVEKDKAALEARLTAIRNKYASEKDLSKAEIRAMNKEIRDAMGEAGIDSKTSGEAISNNLAAGIKEAIGEVTKAVNALAKVLRQNLKLKSNAAEGELSDIETWWTGLGPMLASQIDPAPVAAAGAGLGKALTDGITDTGIELSQPAQDLGDFTIVVEAVSTAIVALRANMAALAAEGIQHFKLLKEGLALHVPPAVAILDTLLDKLNQIREMYLGIAGAADKAGDVTGIDLSSLIGLAEGGIVRKPTLALIGESGPEAVVPLSRTYGSMPGMGGGVNVTVNVSGSVTSERDLVTSIRNAIVAEGRRSGGNLMGGYA